MSDELYIEFVMAGPLIGRAMQILKDRGCLNVDPIHYQMQAYQKDFVWQIPASPPGRIRVMELTPNVAPASMSTRYTVEFIATFLRTYHAAVGRELSDDHALLVAHEMHKRIYHADAE